MSLHAMPRRQNSCNYLCNVLRLLRDYQWHVCLWTPKQVPLLFSQNRVEFDEWFSLWGWSLNLCWIYWLSYMFHMLSYHSLQVVALLCNKTSLRPQKAYPRVIIFMIYMLIKWHDRFCHYIYVCDLCLLREFW